MRRSFVTLTHARLRAEQGDVAGAMSLLKLILAVDPDNPEALVLAARLGRETVKADEDPAEAIAEAPRGARASDLAASFRISLGVSATGRARRTARRLSAWLEGVARARGERRVR